MCAGGLELGMFELEVHLVFGERGGDELPVRDRKRAQDIMLHLTLVAHGTVILLLHVIHRMQGKGKIQK